MKTHQNILLRLIRKGENSTSKNDDVITVRRTFSNGNVSMEYKDARNSSKNTTLISENGFLRYLDTLFVLLENDNDPFKSIQLDCPQYPSILFSISDIGRYSVQDAIKDAVKDTFQNWKMESLKEVWSYEDC